MTGLYEELRDGHSRSSTIVPHEINANIDGLQDFLTNPNVPQIASVCPSGSVKCEMYYEPDWNYRLEANVDCATAIEDDPCFATNACVCENGYFKISKSMPSRENTSANNDGSESTGGSSTENSGGNSGGSGGNSLIDQISDTINEVEAEEEAKAQAAKEEELKQAVTGSSEDESQDYELWVYIVAGVVGVVILITVGIGIFCCLKKCSRKNSLNSTIQPYPMDSETGDKDNKSKKIEVGQLGALTKKKRKQRAHDALEDTAQQPAVIPATDDEKSHLEIANPDSFLNHSAQNFNKTKEEVDRLSA